jgi:hypothetical protein
MEDRVLVTVVGIVCLTALGITYFIFVRSDSTVLLSLASIIGGIIGYRVGKARRE